MANYVMGEGASDAQIVIVGEAPGQREDETGRPFQGPAGGLLNRLLDDVGVKRSDVYVTNVVKYRPPGNKLERLPEIGHSIEEGIPQLWQEIGQIAPNVIIPMGNLALNAVTGKGSGKSGILNYRGSILPTLHLDCKAVPTIHPAALLHSQKETGGKGALPYAMRHIVKMDLERAVVESKTKKYEPPHRVLEIAKEHVSLQRFFDLYVVKGKKRVVSVDIETRYGIPICIAFAFNKWHGISVPLMDVMSWQNGEGVPTHELALIWMIIAELLNDPDTLVLGQNFKFDHSRLHDTCGFRIKTVYLDIMMLAHSLHCEFKKSQGFLTSIYTREPYYKDEGREFDPKKDKVDRLLLYNAKDAVVAFEIGLELIKAAKEIQATIQGFETSWLDEFFFGFQMKMHNFYLEMESVGLAINNPRRLELIEEYKDKIRVAQFELDDLAGWKVNVNSNGPKGQVAKLLFGQFKLPKRGSTDEDTLVALEANIAKHPAIKRSLQLILHLRRLNKAVGTYFEARPDYDRRMRTSVNICGTETGRSSNSILKPPNRPTKVGLAFQTMTKHGDVGTELRSYFVADPGYTLVEYDLSQAEARIVALLGEDDVTLKIFADKKDIHKITSSLIFKVPISSVTSDMRFIGKETRHAGNYDMRKKRLMEMVNTDAKKFGISVSLSEWKAGKILDAFHNANPRIRGTFQPGIVEALRNNNMVLVNPFGRYRQFFDQWGEGLFREAYAHIPQSTVPDHLRRAGLRAKERFKAESLDARYVIEAHDAFVGLVRDAHVPRYAEILKEEMERPIDFSRCTIRRGTLIIPAEGKFGKTYKECKIKGCTGCINMHDLKVA